MGFKAAFSFHTVFRQDIVLVQKLGLVFHFQVPPSLKS